ncbi:MAG: class I tRNA ligase family protein, partial [Eubacteriales bacterium]|nr:class I tRNA ligase family protein [Eubacteriales bacterium]
VVHETIKKVGEDFEAMKYNTAIAAMMSLVNEFYTAGGVTRDELKTLLLLLSPVAPHICEEMWQEMGFGDEIAFQPWPKYDEKAMKRAEVEIAVQVGGKVRGHITINPDMTREQAEKELPQHDDVKALIGDKQLVKLIYVPGRLCNLIVK